MENDRAIWVVDIETIKGIFTYSAYNIDTKDIVQKVLHKDRFELYSLVEHLKECKGHITFNGNNFDYPIIHYIMINYNNWLSLTNKEIILKIYDKAQWIIESQKSEKKIYVNIPDKDILIQQLDLFQLNHFSNQAKRTSLKNVQININYPNVQEMPISHTKQDISEEEINKVLEYNLNDVLSTYEFYKLCIGKIELRKSIGKLYGLNFINKSDSAIGTEILKKEYCKKANVEFYDIKKLKSPYLNLKFKNIISSKVKFTSKELNSFLDKIKEINFKDFDSINIIFRGVKYTFAKGGLHSNSLPKIYESSEDKLILDKDFSSFYPGIIVNENIYPKHLGKEFVEVVKDLTDKRLKAKKDGDKVTTDSLKITINSIYGNLGNEYSFICDYTAMYSVTINGQLFLLMLIEQLTDIEGIECFYSNTDGATYFVKKELVDKFYQICEDFSKYINIPIEFSKYKKCIIRDCNNYIIQTESGKLKNKGFFVIDKEMYQDNSFKIIPIALSEFFIKDIPIKITIRNHTNIYDFCGRQKAKGQDYFETHTLINNQNIIQKQQKNCRYYISKPGSTFIKQYKKGSWEFIDKGYQITIFNKFVEKSMKEYNIDYRFYIIRCQKEIDNIIDNQLNLF